jgi:hypothetical protein
VKLDITRVWMDGLFTATRRTVVVSYTNPDSCLIVRQSLRTGWAALDLPHVLPVSKVKVKFVCARPGGGRCDKPGPVPFNAIINELGVRE